VVWVIIAAILILLPGFDRSDPVSGVPLWIADPNVAGGKRINSSGIHRAWHAAARRSETQCPAQIRRYAGRFDASESVQTPGAAFSSGKSGCFQHLQPPQFRKPHQLPHFSAIRSIDSNAGSVAGKRRTEWRPQSAISKSADRVRRNWLLSFYSEQRYSSALSGYPTAVELDYKKWH
jgi:hypothetical protein